MLFKRGILGKIAAGEVDRAFRRWTRPTVRAGSTLRTSVGLLEIRSIVPVRLSALTGRAARRAGYANLEELRADLGGRTRGIDYEIRLRRAGPDPRIALRARARFGAAERAALIGKVRRLDARRARPWVVDLLRCIGKNRGKPAAALDGGQDTAKLKRDVRRLKELGLTISLGTGYELSPRGRAALRFLA